MIKIATWNVNSINARLNNFRDWLDIKKPDIVLLQEIKCLEEKFPYQMLEDFDYNIEIKGQKTFNGVAIFSKFPLEDVITSLPGNESDEQARYIEAVVNINEKTLRIASVYVPNGSEVGSEKFSYKMDFFKKLEKHLAQLLMYEEILVVGGDFNVAPKDIDVYDPDSLKGSICFHTDEQKSFRKITNLGFYDAFRAKNPDKQKFSWWDYRGGSWQHNKGMRIDFLLLSPEAIDICEDSDIDEKTRGEQKASDHAPVICTLNLS